MKFSVISHKTKFIYKGKKRLKRSILSYIKQLGADPGDLTIIITNDYCLREINKKHLGKNYFTDVISFDYSSENNISGDIFLSIDRVRENRKIFKEKLYDELDRIIIHGILHLLGYKDDEASEKEIMINMENEFLELRSEKFK